MVLPVVASGSVTEFPQLRPGGRGRERNGGTADSERWTRLAAYRITRVRGRHREHLQGRRPGRGGELRQVFTAPGKLSRLRASICVGSVIPAPSRMRPPTDRPERGATGGRVGDAGTGRSIASHVRPSMSGRGRRAVSVWTVREFRRARATSSTYPYTDIRGGGERTVDETDIGFHGSTFLFVRIFPLARRASPGLRTPGFPHGLRPGAEHLLGMRRKSRASCVISDQYTPPKDRYGTRTSGGAAASLHSAAR